MEKRLDRTSEVYAGTYSTPVFQRHHRKRINWMCASVRGRRVLDIGCSQGIAALLLAREGYEVVGIDVEQELIQQANEALSKESDAVRARATFQVADLLDPQFGPVLFDTIIAGEVLEHLLHPERVIERAWQLLREGGTLVVTVPFGVHPYPDHKQTFYATTLLSLLSPRFEVDTIELIHIPEGAASVVPIMGVVATKRPDCSPEVKDRSADWLRFSDEAFGASEARYVALTGNLETRNAELQRRVDAAEQASQESRDTVMRLTAQLQQTSDRDAHLQAQLRASEEREKELGARLAAATAQTGRLERLERELRAAAGDRDRAIWQLRSRLSMMEGATSYRLGLLIVRSFLRPYLLLLLPFRAVGLLCRAALAKMRGQKRAPRLANLPVEPRPLPGPERAASAQRSAVGAKVSPSAIPGGPAAPSARLKLPPPPTVEIPAGPVRGLDLRVAAIMDEFSWLCYRYECNLLKLTPDRWREIMSETPPDFLLVESAWFGNDREWGPVTVYGTRQPREPLPQLVQWCRANDIPTVFWNKEDPLHCDYFMETARLFDFVFTTDANCIPKYQQLLGHDRVYPLIFGAQPMIHNPAPVPGGRRYDLAFAGSWYGSTGYDDRKAGVEAVLRPALDFGPHIYDRNFGADMPPERYAWPAEFRSSIVGGVSYKEMLAVYRQYKAFLNVNIVVDSPTMFSRRVFELLACGTPVVSSYARGIAEQLGPDIVLMSRSAEETRSLLKRVLRDDAFRAELSDRGIRSVMSRHTYGHRLREIVEKVGRGGSAVAPLNAARAADGSVRPRPLPRVEIPRNSPGLCLPPPSEAAIPDGPIRRPGLKVGVIMDQVFLPCWRYEAQLVAFTPGNWREVLSREKPAFVFIDSAWRGNNESWRFHIQRGMEPLGPSSEFADLVLWCKRQRIPTVFWNREDPPNYRHFIGAAQLCDYVFTTDSDCLDGYRSDCGHDRVFVLPFAAQPRIHNPAAAGRRQYDLSFFGTWYAIKHPDRIQQMKTILRPALDYGVHIFDRRLYHAADDHFDYPEEFRPHIAGSLSYEETLAAMRQYRVTLNVNSVIESPTMCSCRVFEGLMAGAAVISGYARGIENLLGRDVVPMPRTPDEMADCIELLLNDPGRRERMVHLAQRKILRQHTYSQRFDAVLEAIGLADHILGTKLPLVSVLLAAQDGAAVEAALQIFQRQTYEPKELIIVSRCPGEEMAHIHQLLSANGSQAIQLITAASNASPAECLESGLRAGSGAYVLVLDPDDHYGPMFLSDLQMTLAHADTQIVGKACHYVFDPEGDRLLLSAPDSQHTHTTTLAPASMLVRRDVFDTVSIGLLAANGGAEFLRQCAERGVTAYASDSFNYVRVIGGSSLPSGDLVEVSDGMDEAEAFL